MPVVVVTHNSTVGGSIGADYLLYASADIVDGAVEHRIYSGHPTDKKLVSVDGHEIPTHSVYMDSLEAGELAYNERKDTYESVKT